jgi:hypothetical protein
LSEPHDPSQPSVFDWLKFALGAVQLLGALVSFLRERQLINAGGLATVAQALRAQADDLHKIKDAMADAGQRFDAAGGVLPADGKYRD